MEKNELLEKDKRWDLWQIDSIDHFKNIASKTNLNPAVSKEIIKRFDVIKELIIHSYFEYEFLDVALDRTLVTFEMALRERYYELTNKESKKMRFVELINWSANQGLFEDDEKTIHRARELRNNLTAHPKGNHLLGYLAIQTTLRTIDIINDLYEDINTRKARKQEEEQVNNKLNDFLKDGAVLELNDSKLIIFLAALLFFNNKVIPNKYHFLFYPIFDPTEKENNTINIPDPILNAFNSWQFIDNVFYLSFNNNEKQVKIKKILKPENIRKYKKWKQDFESSKFPIQNFIDTRISEFRLQLRKINC